MKHDLPHARHLQMSRVGVTAFIAPWSRHVGFRHASSRNTAPDETSRVDQSPLPFWVSQLKWGMSMRSRISLGIMGRLTVPWPAGCWLDAHYAQLLHLGSNQESLD